MALQTVQPVPKIVAPVVWGLELKNERWV